MILFNDWHWNFGVFERKGEEFLFEYDEKTSDFVLNQEFLGKFGKNKQKLVESDFQEAKKESMTICAALSMLEDHEEVMCHLLDVNMYDLLEVHDKTDFRFMMHLNHTYGLDCKTVRTEQMWYNPESDYVYSTEQEFEEDLELHRKELEEYAENSGNSRKYTREEAMEDFYEIECAIFGTTIVRND